MSINFNTISDPQSYDRQLKDFMRAVESTRDEAYIDTNGNPTIGWGFALNDRNTIRTARDHLLKNVLGVQNADITKILTTPAKTREGYYYTRLISFMEGPWAPDGTISGNGASSQVLRAGLNQILADRAAEIRGGSAFYNNSDSIKLFPLRDTFSFSSLAEIEATFDLARVRKDIELDGKIPSIPNSAERIALFSMRYQGALGDAMASKLKQAFALPDANDAHAEAWYLLRYRDTKEKDRYYMEAARFGLYRTDQPLTSDVAKGVYRMYSRHANEMIAYDAANVAKLTSANSKLLGIGLSASGLIRAAMVSDPGGYRWSSYRANGLAQPDTRLTPHPLYLGLDRDATVRCCAYRALFRPQLDADAASEVREALQLGMPLGSERFAEAICARLGIRRNTGKRGRAPGDKGKPLPARIEQQGFGF